MGKQKRARQKYHLASVKFTQKAENDGDVEMIDRSFEQTNWSVTCADNIFKGIHIDVDKIKKSLSDDAISVRSIAKSIASSSGKHLKKEEKRKLKHNLFIQRIDAIYKGMEELKKKSGKNKNKEEKVELDLSKSLLENKVIREDKKVPKAMGTLKVKQRKKFMLKDIEVFKKVLSDPEYKKNPLEAVSMCIKKKIEDDIL